MDNRYYFEIVNNNEVIISGGEALHLSKVRRAKIGDEITGFNGDGYNYSLKIVEITKDKVKTQILDKTLNKSAKERDICVYLSYIKNDALTEIVDHLAELNVKKLKLFKSDFSVAQFDDKKLNKLKQIAIQASKQSERADVMQISLITKKEIEKDIETYENKFFAYENSNNKIENFEGNFAVVIGPEGGFSKEEVEYFSRFCKNVSLGSTILRAEVAGVVAVAILKAVSQ